MVPWANQVTGYIFFSIYRNGHALVGILINNNYHSYSNWATKRSSNLGKKTRHGDNLQVKIKFPGTETQVLKRCQKTKKKKLWKTEVTAIPIIIAAHRKRPKVSWKSQKSEDELRPSKLQHCYDPDIGIMVRVFANGPGDFVQSQVESYQRLKKWYLMPPCLTLSNLR